MPPPAAPSPALRAAWGLLLTLAAAAALLFVVLVAQRVAYPHELEWMEGAMVDHASRIAHGLPLYGAPGPEHVPFLYAPLLFWLGGLGIAFGLPGLVALRLCAALATVGAALLIGHWVRRETGRLAPGLVATGLFLAGYGWLHWWYDLARNDSLFVLATLGCAYTFRHGGRAGWLAAALLAAVAVLAKQSAIMWLPAIGVGALLWDWRAALRFGFAALIAIGLAVGLLHLQSDGWSTFYLFEMPRHHAIDGSRKLGFWTEDLLPMLPLVALGLGGFVAQAAAGERRAALFLAAFGSGGLVTSWLSRLHVGGFDNVMMYGFAGACVLGPVAAAAKGSVLRVAGPLLLLAQFTMLGWTAVTREPARTALPSPAHRAAHEQLLAYVRAQPGEVLIPGHGGVSAAAGKRPGAHGQAIFDLLQVLPKRPDGFLDLEVLADPARLALLSPRAQQALLAFRDGLLQALLQKRYRAIVLDESLGGVFEVLFLIGLVGPDGQRGTPDDLYRRREAPLLTEPEALRPLVGKTDVHSPYALEAIKGP